MKPITPKQTLGLVFLCGGAALFAGLWIAIGPGWTLVVSGITAISIAVSVDQRMETERKMKEAKINLSARRQTEKKEATDATHED